MKWKVLAYLSFLYSLSFSHSSVLIIMHAAFLKESGGGVLWCVAVISIYKTDLKKVIVTFRKIKNAGWANHKCRKTTFQHSTECWNVVNHAQKPRGCEIMSTPRNKFSAGVRRGGFPPACPQDISGLQPKLLSVRRD